MLPCWVPPAACHSKAPAATMPPYRIVIKRPEEQSE